MFTTELSHRILLTVLLLLAIGNCQEQQEQGEDEEEGRRERGRHDKSGETDDNEEALFRSVHLGKPIDLMELQDEDLKGDFAEERNGRIDWRTRHRSTTPGSDGMTTLVSSTSYSVKPGNSASTVLVNAKPFSIITAAKKTEPSSSSSYYLKGSPYFQSYNKKKGEQSTYNSRNNCFGNKCSAHEGPVDEWKTYHSALNSGIGSKKYQENPSRSSINRNSNSHYDDFNSGGQFHTKFASFPFMVEPAVPVTETRYLDRYPLSQRRPGHRVSRRTTTSTNSPGWIKLQPVFSSAEYDPFSLASSKPTNLHNKSKDINKLDSTSQFSNRLGVELNPDSFADRWGWSADHGHKHGDKGGGSRLPSWLQELSQNLQDSRRPIAGPTRDGDNRNWVKLDPIPVAGVSISKWVPKGTSPSELPTTNWPVRDKPGAWWDRVDTSTQHKYHGDGWPSKASTQSAHSSAWNTRYSTNTKKPTNSWNDIVYPDGPTSATASWESNKAGLSSYPSSFPLATPSSSHSSWPSDIRRPVTGSWSAPKSSSSNAQYDYLRPPSSFPGSSNRNRNPSSYPDLHADNDDPRWVLVSNSRRVTVSPNTANRHSSPSPSYLQDIKNYHHKDIDRYSDFPFYESSESGHRVGKDLFKRTSIRGTTPDYREREDAFNRVNATLQTLTPVLGGRGQRRQPPYEEPENSSGETENYSQSGSGSNLPPELNSYIGDSRATSDANNSTRIATQKNRGRKGFGIHPIYAAVGAGMIPATMAAVLPMVLGRKKRQIDENLNLNQNHIRFINPENEDQMPVLFPNLYLFPGHANSYQGVKLLRSYKAISHNDNHNKPPRKIILR